MPSEKRVLIIGLDGFTWRLGRVFMDEGIMPNLANLVRSGCHGDLKSTIPFETGPAWSSFQTGSWPNKTSVFAFHRYDRGAKKIRLNSFADIAVPSLWELADRAGKRVVSLNMPVTSPPPKVNGIIIPGLLCPKLSPQTVHPPQAYDKYIKPHKDYLIVNNRFRDTIRAFTQQSIETERIRTQIALDMIRGEDWDIFCMQMQSSDIMQHRVWAALDRDAKAHCDLERKEAIEFYRFCDQSIGSIVKAAGDDVLTLIASDHGFCKSNGFASINVWLRQQGYLKLLPQKETIWQTTKKRVPLLKKIAGLYGNTVKKWIADDKNKLFCEVMLDHLRRIIDFDKTRAFCLGGMAGLIYINGTSQQRTQLSKRLKDELLQELGPDSQTPVLAGITSGTQTYGTAGDIDLLPDLVLELQEGYMSRTHPMGDLIIPPDPYSGTHNREGILVINGPDIRSQTKLDGDIVDIVPTILAYMGIPVPKHVDGEVLNGAFEKPLTPCYEDVAIDSQKSVEYTDEEQAQVEKNLKDLGYL